MPDAKTKDVYVGKIVVFITRGVKGLSHLDAETVFFTPKLYIDTASG